MTRAIEQLENATYTQREVGREKRHRDGGTGRSVQRNIVKTSQIQHEHGKEKLEVIKDEITICKNIIGSRTLTEYT